MRNELSWPEMTYVKMSRLWQQVWPFQRGRAILIRGLALARSLGLFQPVWRHVSPGIWMHLDPQDLIQREILVNGVWEPRETEFLRRYLRQGSVFLDIGANIGYFTLLASRLVGAEGSVLSVEPNPHLANKLREAINRSQLGNVRLTAAACSQVEQVQTLYFGQAFNSGRTSLSAENAMSTCGTPVKCLRADCLVNEAGLSRLDLIKIDVEGAELQVLQGLTDTIARFRPPLLIEIEPERLKPFKTRPEDIRQFLREFGYTDTLIDGCNFAFEANAVVHK